MAKKKNILLTHGTLHVPLDQMMSIDIEGAPTLVKQVSIYDFNHELLYNKTALAGKELAQGEITKIQRILNRARVLVGHSLDSDLMALRRRGVYLYNDTRCLDTYFTFMEMKEKGLLDARYNGATLKETALYFHIRANDYHTSYTDALAAAVVMREMMKQGEGLVVEITPSIIQIPRPPFGMEPDWEKEEREDMAQNKIIGPKADSRVYKIGDFYECVIAGSQGQTFVRMTQEEYDLFLRIRELRPDYTVRLYSETILTPSIVARLAAMEEAEKAAETVTLATAPEKVEVEDLTEEAENPVSEEIEEVSVPASEEIAEEEPELTGETEKLPEAGEIYEAAEPGKMVESGKLLAEDTVAEVTASDAIPLEESAIRADVSHADGSEIKEHETGEVAAVNDGQVEKTMEHSVAYPSFDEEEAPVGDVSENISVSEEAKHSENEHKAEEKKENPVDAEDAFSMSLFFELENEEPKL